MNRRALPWLLTRTVALYARLTRNVAVWQVGCIGPMETSRSSTCLTRFPLDDMKRRALAWLLTRHRVSCMWLTRNVALWQVGCIGPMAATVEDVALVYLVMAGQDPQVQTATFHVSQS